MSVVELDDQEWQIVMGMIATAPWRDANPLLMKIGDQLRKQHNGAKIMPKTPANKGDLGDNKRS